MGLAVFKSDKLVGELTANETLCHLLIKDEVESCNISVPDPQDSNSSMDLFIYNRSKPKIKVNIINGTPYIQLELKLDAKVLSIEEQSNYITNSKLQKIANSANAYMKSILLNYLYKTSKELNSDITGFGKYALRCFNTNTELANYNWLGNYKNAFFNVTVDTRVQSAFLLGG